MDITVRFKHGIHTIFLFVEPTTTFDEVSSELLEILHERYPDGLTTSLSQPKTVLPSDPSLIEFGILKMATDPSQGWRALKIGPKDTPTTKGVKDGMTLAFAFRHEDEEKPGQTPFEVEFPSYEDDAALEEEEVDDDEDDDEA